jgi:hypothetical protein
MQESKSAVVSNLLRGLPLRSTDASADCQKNRTFRAKTTELNTEFIRKFTTANPVKVQKASEGINILQKVYPVKVSDQVKVSGMTPAEVEHVLKYLLGKGYISPAHVNKAFEKK